MPVRDVFGRPLQTLRLSVTDRCNLRCRYCMPDETYKWMPGRDILTFEELTTLATAFVRLGVGRIRLTGGEPLLRRDLHVLVSMLRQANPECELCLTTNGVLLERCADSLARAGLDRVTISLDSLNRAAFRRMASKDLLPRVLAGIEAARQARFRQIKLNCVVVRGLNDEELPRLVQYGRQIGAEVRLIEYMELAGTRHWSPQSFVSKHEMLERIEAALGLVEPLTRRFPLRGLDFLPAIQGQRPAACQGEPACPHRLGTAEAYRCSDGTTFGIIAPMTAPFCETCTRGRLTADGQFYLCLHADHAIDLRSIIRSSQCRGQVAALIAATWEHRTNRGAQQPRLLADRRLWSARPVHIRMHARGG